MYITFSFSSSLLVALICSLAYNYKYQYFQIGGSWLLATAVIYVLTAIASIIYAYRKMRKPGISQEVRQLFFQRHVLSIILFFIAYLYFFTSLGIVVYLYIFENIANLVNEHEINNIVLSGLKILFTI